MSDEITPNRKAPRKTGLGRGLGSLLGGGLDDVQEEGFQEKDLKKKTTPTPKQHQKSKVEANKIEATKVQAPAPAPIPETERIFQFPIEQLVPNKEQPRKEFTPDELKELADSIF